jgi:YD repeat-containing protein
MGLTKIYAIIVLVTLSINSQAQTTQLKFSYDDAGNRVKREIILGKSKEATMDTTTATMPITDWLNKMKISIYPNPTKGILIIDIANMPEDATGDITIHNMEGKSLLKLNQLNSTNKLDLAGYPTGVYVLRIRSLEKSCEWKIVKE